MIYVGLFIHFVADFLLQTSRLTEFKTKNILLGNLLHAFIIFMAYTSILLFVFPFNLIESMMILVSIVTISHFIIDILKSVIIKLKNNAKLDLVAYIVDQIIHFVLIIVIFGSWEYQFDENYFRTLFLISIYIFVMFFGDITIRKTFKAIKLVNYDKRADEIKGVGSLIGKIERFIILTMVLSSHPEVAIAIIGVKSIARFPEFNNQQERNNDYFILGNLLSILFVILGFLIYSKLPGLID